MEESGNLDDTFIPPDPVSHHMSPRCISVPASCICHFNNAEAGTSSSSSATPKLRGILKPYPREALSREQRMPRWPSSVSEGLTHSRNVEIGRNADAYSASIDFSPGGADMTENRRELRSESVLLERRAPIADWDELAGILDKAVQVQDPLKAKRHCMEFNNIWYSVNVSAPGKFAKRRKYLLSSVSGSFQTGEFVGILGPSGAGKSTLFNVLAGIGKSNTTGSVRLTDITERSGSNTDVSSELRKNRSICYIPQAVDLMPHLTVCEAVTVSANLNIPTTYDKKYKQHLVTGILERLGLSRVRNTRTSDLSGGEKKRLTIAVELVHDPHVLLVDEPITGLDSRSGLECLRLLRSMTDEGKIVVCSIHSPSARLFEMFNKVYILADGLCIYSGKRDDMVSELSNFGLICPETHNPADFVIEIATSQYGDWNRTLAQHAAHQHTSDGNDNKSASGASSNKSRSNYVRKSVFQFLKPHTYTTGFWNQLFVLFTRIFICIFRDLHLTRLRAGAHVGVGLLLGLLYHNIGKEAQDVTDNCAFLFFSIFFLIFATLMPTLMSSPIELAVLTREHRNGWYGTVPYYFAKMAAELPFQLLLPTVYTLIVYWLTGQPHEGWRFALFLAISIQTAMAAESLGLLVCALASSLQVAIFMGPVTAVPFLLFSGFFIRVGALSWAFRWISTVSFTRSAFEASLLAIYGFERPHLSCGESSVNSTECFAYRDPKNALKLFDLEDGSRDDVMVNLGILIACIVLMRMVGYIALVWKLRRNN